MSLQKILFNLLIFTLLFQTTNASEPGVKYELYGFIRNDFYFNSRQNVEALDGVFNIFPKPEELNSKNKDKNAQPNAQLLSVATRVGFNFSGTEVAGAKATAKIEFDFAGISTSYYLIRLRQAYLKLNSRQTELLIGQTWHPLFGSVSPSVMSLNTGAPFQPFNRSPQITLKQNLTKTLLISGSAIYQMQYTSQGPLGPSASYIKNALVPNLFTGIENKTRHWITGLGIDTKTIKPGVEKLSTVSGVAYAQYVNKNFQIKTKTLFGQNLSDHLMIGGYGISEINQKGDSVYSAFNNLSSWLNIVFGKKIQHQIFVGFSKNIGTTNNLLSNPSGNFTAYGYGFYPKTQIINDQLTRLSYSFWYNIQNFRTGIEYDITGATYGTLENSGHVKNPYNVINQRIALSACYFF